MGIGSCPMGPCQQTKLLEGGAVPEVSPRGTCLLIADALRKEIEEGQLRAVRGSPSYRPME